MKHIVAVALALVLLGGGKLLADEAWFVKVDLRTQNVIVKVGDRADSAQEQTLDGRQVRVFNAAGRQLKLEEVDRLRPGTRLEYKAREGRILELKVLPKKF
jgi:hypothetical protein